MQHLYFTSQLITTYKCICICSKSKPRMSPGFFKIGSSQMIRNNAIIFLNISDEECWWATYRYQNGRWSIFRSRAWYIFRKKLKRIDNFWNNFEKQSCYMDYWTKLLVGLCVSFGFAHGQGWLLNESQS